ncbi:MAG TPA: serine/threonine-protein kinase [Kofleriaceae bacterium]|nr:serine/threonine-protein kinase [Kofleriaceae bacterium]
MTDEALDETADAGTAKAPSALVPGSQLGKYKLERVLGEGGMGVVWAAQDPDLERAVAIKVLRYAQAALQLRQRLLREARAMAKLKHPNVLTVYEVGTSGDRDYIAMELVDGQSLDVWFKHATEDERWTAIMAAGRGLAAAHAAGVVHRDFKPHNVLRSKEGRVLVTDFGLARGLVGDSESPAVGVEKQLLDPAVSPFDATVTPQQSPQAAGRAQARGIEPASVEPVTGKGIDTPLTQTGALIGTPAYMAPEQYLGATPDPRTDQFAFCVTVWQALTGERPFKGQTLDEMRKSAGGGVAHIQAKMPGAIRAVLARGLDPDAKKRWPSLEELLDALDHARMRPVRRRRLAFAMFGMAMAVVLFLVMQNRGTERVQTSCDDPDRVIAEAAAPVKGLGRVASAFDDFSKRWVESYRQTCKLPKSKTRTARINCLEGARDDVSALALVLHDAPPEARDRFDAPSILPNLKSCEGSSPLVGVIVPRDQPRRDNAIKMMASTFALQRIPIDQLGPAIEKHYAEAKSLAGEEFASSVLVTGGTAYQQAGHYDEARTLYTRFLKLPAPRNARLEAIVRVNLLEASIHQLVEPRAKTPANINDPHTKPSIHPELASLIAAARSAAGSDDAVLGAIDILEADVWLAAGQWNRYKTAYSDALEAAERARKHFEAIGDGRRTAMALATEARIFLARGDERALDDALFASRQAADIIERGQLAPIPEVDEFRARIAFMRRDLTEAHRRYDAITPHHETDGQLRSGTITGAPAGTPVTVVTWTGELVGDRVRLYTGISELHGDVAQLRPDGTFEIKTSANMAIIAEAKGLRSRPQLVGASGPIALALEPTTTVSGSLAGPNLLEVNAFAHREVVKGTTLVIEAPVDRDGTFDLAGLPVYLTGESARFGLEGAAGDGQRVVANRDIKRLFWSYGQAVEVIVRGAKDDARAYILWGDAHVTSPKDLDTLMDPTTPGLDAATCEAHPIGADNTDAGRDVYRPGDLHCTITGNTAGDVTICAVSGDQVRCTPARVQTTVEVTYPDGRYAAGVTPVLVAF